MKRYTVTSKPIEATETLKQIPIAKEIIAVLRSHDLNYEDAKKALDAFITSVTNAMKAGDKVSLVGFGTFSVSERAERTGINPSTKATITIPAKKVAKFKPGAELSAAVE